MSIKEIIMNRLFSIVWLVMILGLAACSGPDPSAPESASVPTLLQNEEASVSESKSALDVDHQHDGTYWGRYLHGNKEAFTLQTNQNAYKMERAVWRFIDGNEGVIPRNFWERNLSGKTLIDYLPGKKPLINPFTMCRTEPQLMPAAVPGQVGYMDISDAMGNVVGFIISAWGWEKQSLEIIRYLPLPPSLPKPGPPLKSDGFGHG
jgi:hypothetical protein